MSPNNELGKKNKCKGHPFGRNGFPHRPKWPSLSAEAHTRFARLQDFMSTQ